MSVLFTPPTSAERREAWRSGQFVLDHDCPLNRGLVLGMQLGRHPGSTVFDYSGYGNHGTKQNGPTRTPVANPKLGRWGLDFDGTDDLVQVTRDSSFEAEQLTLSAWVNMQSISESYNTIFDKPNTSHSNPFYDFHMRFNSSTSLRCYFVVGSFSETDQLAVTVPSVLNRWVHVAGTFDGSTIACYTEGVQRGTKTNVGSITYHNTDLYIGSFKNVTTGNFDDLLDDVRIYNRAWTPDEITQVYREPWRHVLPVRRRAFVFDAAPISAEADRPFARGFANPFSSGVV